MEKHTRLDMFLESERINLSDLIAEHHFQHKTYSKQYGTGPNSEYLTRDKWLALEWDLIKNKASTLSAVIRKRITIYFEHKESL